jgi:hypothetical protein
MSYELKYLKYKNKYFALKNNIYGYSQQMNKNINLKNMVGYGISEKEKEELKTEVSFLVDALKKQREKEELLLEHNINELTTKLDTTGINYGQARMILKDSIYDFHNIMKIFKQLGSMHANYTKYTRKEYLDLVHNITSGARIIQFYRITPEQEKLAQQLIAVGIDDDIARMIVTSIFRYGTVNERDIPEIINLFETFKSLQDVLVPGDGRTYNYNKKEYSKIIYNIVHSCKQKYESICNFPTIQSNNYIIILKKIFSIINLNNKIYTVYNFYGKLLKLFRLPGEHIVEVFMTFLQDVDYNIHKEPGHILKLVEAASRIYDEKHEKIFDRSLSYKDMDDKEKVHSAIVADIYKDIKKALPEYITSLKQTPKK